MENFENRLNKLEKSNKSLRSINIMLISVIFISGFIGWQAASQYFETLETSKFILKDKAGLIRASLQVNDDNSVSLDLYDQTGKESLNIGINKDNYAYVELTGAKNTLLLNDDGIYLKRDGKTSVRIYSGDSDEIAPIISLNDLKGNPRMAMLGTNVDTVGAGYYIIDKNQNVSMHLKDYFLEFSRDTVTKMQLLSTGIFSGLQFMNDEGELMASFQSTLFGSSLDLYDLDGKKIIRLGDQRDSEAERQIRGLEVFNTNGKTMLELGTNYDGDVSLLSLFNENFETIRLFSSKEDSEFGIFDSKFMYLHKLSSGENFASPYLFVAKENKGRFDIAFDKGMQMMSRVLDGKNNVRILQGFDDNKKPFFRLYDASGMGRLSLGAQSLIMNNGKEKNYPESSIWLFNETGNSVFYAPE